MDLRACLTAAELRSISFNIRLGARVFRPAWFSKRVLVLLDLLTHLKNAVKDSFFQMGPIGSISRRGAHSGVLPIQAF